MSKVETTRPDETFVLADLMTKVAAQTDRTASLTTLVDCLADQIKATSNDQNIQRLARALRAVAPALVKSIAAKTVQPHTDARHARD